jgi:hypothetical protein
MLTSTVEATAMAAVDQVTSTDTQEAAVVTQTEVLVDMVAAVDLTEEELAAIACLTSEQVSRSKTGVSRNV